MAEKIQTGKLMRGIGIALLMSFSLLLFSGKGPEVITHPEASMYLQMEMAGGKNGVDVAFNPEKKIYYAAIGGNEVFPLETFSETGEHLYYTTAKSDLRSIWWNTKTSSLEGNCYKDGGIVNIGLVSNGYPGAGNWIIHPGKIQPSDNSSGAYDYLHNKIVYHDRGILTEYSRANGKPSQKAKWLSFPVSLDHIAENSLIFTGKTGCEFGVLDYVEKKVYLFNYKTLEISTVIHLPEDAICNSNLNFSFANNHIWLFDMDTRVWVGYKIFK